MKKINTMNIGELAAFVCSYLENNGIICVLSGGSCVSIYTNNKYMSYDLDFIERYDSGRKIITRLMLELGFQEENRYFTHPGTKFFIEFPSGPLAIGSEPVKEISEIEFETGILKILTPTDCVKDRLAAYYYWDDLQSLEQAIMVAKDNPIKINEIERWSKAEGQENKFDKIKSKFSFSP